MSEFDPKCSELELKFEIDEKLFNSPDKLSEFLSGFNTPMHIKGMDQFFSINKKFFRIRSDKVVVDPALAPSLVARTEYCLTVKERIAPDSLVQRREVDLSVGPNDNPVEFFKMLGAEEVFRIFKEYHVWTHKSRFIRSPPPELMVATYRVSDSKDENVRYFLEIEVEKTGANPLEERLRVLNGFAHKLKEAFPIGEALNKSLFEIYCPTV